MQNTQISIHAAVEILINGVWVNSQKEIFLHRSVHMSPDQIDLFIKTGEARQLSSAPFQGHPYAVFAFLGGIDDDYGIISPASHRGIPNDVSEPIRDIIDAEFNESGFGFSWVSLQTLLAVDYNKTTPDGKTLYELFGPRYFADLTMAKKLARPDQIRIIFWFDETK